MARAMSCLMYGGHLWETVLVRDAKRCVRCGEEQTADQQSPEAAGVPEREKEG